MLRITRLAAALGLLAGLAAPQFAAAAIWSIKSDCSEADWTITVHLDGFGTVDASCHDGNKVEHSIDTGALAVTSAQVEAISSLGTLCHLPAATDAKLVLKCSAQGEDSAGNELEDEIEVEIEREDAEPAEEDEAEEEEKEDEEPRD
jgi:hypothetical protein